MVGSDNRSILKLGMQAESYKAWYVAPLPVEKMGSEGVVDRKLASSPRVSAGAHKKETLERQSTDMHSITTKQAQASKEQTSRVKYDAWHFK